MLAWPRLLLAIPTLLFVLITSLISSLSAFVLMLVLTEGGPVRATTVTGLYIYDMAFSDLRLGRASAGAYILFAIILATHTYIILPLSPNQQSPHIIIADPINCTAHQTLGSSSPPLLVTW